MSEKGERPSGEQPWQPLSQEQQDARKKHLQGLVPLYKLPWRVLTKDQREVRKECLRVLHEMRRTGNPLSAIQLPEGLTTDIVVENIRSALIGVCDTFVARPEDKIEVEVDIITKGKLMSIVVGHSDYAADSVGYYWTVYMFFEHGDKRYLKPFRGRKITDVNGISYPYETNSDRLEAMLVEIRGGKFDALYV